MNYYNIRNQANNSCNDSLHAEVDCVNRLKPQEKPTKINLIVFRTNNTGDYYSMAKPCRNCLMAIDKTLSKKNYVLKRLYYTRDNNFIRER